MICHFYPRSPYGERPAKADRDLTNYIFLSTLSLRRATSGVWMDGQAAGYFYPRSPYGERRQYGSRCAERAKNFYPRSPYGERHLCGDVRFPNTEFLSTLSLRRATRLRELDVREDVLFLSTLSLRRATSGCNDRTGRAGGFLSTLSLRRATAPAWRAWRRWRISIHALLTESDISSRTVRML